MPGRRLRGARPRQRAAARRERRRYDGVRFAVRYINDGGIPDLNLPLAPGKGLPGLGGAKIDLRAVDSRGDRCTAESLFTGLAKDGVAAVIGAYESTVTLQAITAPA